MLKGIVIVATLLVSISASASATIYGYVDAEGCQHFTNVRPAAGSYTVLVLSKEAPTRERMPAGTASFWRDGDEPNRLMHHATAYLGVPYRFGGETLEGIDCSAFVQRVFSPFDVRLPRSAREQFAVGQRISRGSLAVGDLVFFKTRRDVSHPTHVGIFIGNDRFIHASSLQERRVRIDSLSDQFYDRAYIGATRVKEIGNSVPVAKNLSSNTASP